MLDQVDKGWLDGPSPPGEEGQLLAGEGPRLVNLTLRFGVQQGEDLRAVDDLKRSQTNRAAVVHAPMNIPAWDHFAAAIRPFHEAGPNENVAMARADNRAA